MLESTRVSPRYEQIVTTLVIAIVAYLNATNWCSPGWCYTYGWPFTFFAESDAILILDGETEQRGFFLVPFAGDLAIALTLTAAATLAARIAFARKKAAV